LKSYNFFIANRTSFFIFQPFINAFCVVLMTAFLQFLEFLKSFKFIKTNWAGVFVAVPFFKPLFFSYLTNLSRSKSFVNLSISLLKLQKLFISHGISIRIIRIIKSFNFTLLNGFLKKSLLLSFTIYHAIHHNLHH